MATTPEPLETAKPKSMYFVEDSGAELARLVEQERAFTKVFGGLLPEHADEAVFVAPFHRVLDVACGSGAWLLEMAQTYPHLEVMGFDIDTRMINYANTQASVGRLDNASFKVMDARKPLDYPDAFFDLVNARWISVIGTAAWPATIREMVRVTRPGGVIRITESEDFSLTTSPAFERLSELFIHAIKLGGIGFSPTGRTGGQTPKLARFLRDAGCQHIQQKAFVIDWSTGTEVHDLLVEDHRALLKLIQPYLIKMGVTTQEEVDQLYHEAEIEMLADDFCALWYLLTVWGEKPSISNAGPSQ
jgi:ubiquinone/menaquinone biosynthesis C-methylase UbiE